MSMSLQELQAQYHLLEGIANRFAASLADQLHHLLKDNGIPLGVPIEYRVKSWNSIAEKVERKQTELQKLSDLSDLVGLRLMLLFKRDVNKSSEMICRTFAVIEKEDTVGRLKEDQFGYQSLHLLVRMPQGWLKVPSLAEFVDLKAEIQIRTLAQHIWAGASHHLQYKRESGVPLPIRRSINRVSALLETVDLEFERVLDERTAYLSDIVQTPHGGGLNVDLLAQVLDEALPAANKEPGESYSEVMDDLKAFGIETVDGLRDLLESTREAVLARDAKEVQAAKRRRYIGTSKERNDRGIFFTHVGLVRQALEEKYGKERWDAYISRTAHEENATDEDVQE